MQKIGVKFIEFAETKSIIYDKFPFHKRYMYLRVNGACSKCVLHMSAGNSQTFCFSFDRGNFA